MSRFYGEVEGARGCASRTGHTRIEGHIRGWNVGVRVVGEVSAAGDDEFFVYATGGSNGGVLPRLLARVKLDADGNLLASLIE